jgi:hypothetical protein
VGGLNDWKIITLTPTEGCDSDKLDVTNVVILDNITTIMAENIDVGLIGDSAPKMKTPMDTILLSS